MLFSAVFSTTFLIATQQLLKLPQTNDLYKVVCTLLELDCLTLESVMWHDFMFVVVDPGGAFLKSTSTRHDESLFEASRYKTLDVDRSRRV